MAFLANLGAKTATLFLITCILSTTLAEPLTSHQSIYLQVRDVGTKYHKRAPSYVGFSGDDGIIVSSKEEAALFELKNDHLVFGNESVAPSSSRGYQVFQKSFTHPKGVWSRDGDLVEYQDANISTDGEGSSFCVSKDNSLFIELTSYPSFTCKEVALKAVPVEVDATTSAAEATITSPPVEEPHQEMKRDPRGGSGGGGSGRGGSGRGSSGSSGSGRGSSGSSGSGRGSSGNSGSGRGSSGSSGSGRGSSGNSGSGNGGSGRGGSGRGGRPQPSTTTPPTPDPSSDIDKRDEPVEVPEAEVDMKLVRRGGVVRSPQK